VKCGLIVFASCIALLGAGRAQAANVLVNGSFEGSLSGWEGWNSTLSLASDGDDGSGAALVTGSSEYYSIDTSPRPVGTHAAGVTYTAGGSARTDDPGQSLCLYIREWNGSSKVAQTSSCITGTTGWQQFPPVTYTTKGGSSIDVYVLADGTSGDSFEVDGLTLDDGSGGTQDTTPPDTTITSGPASGSSTTSTSASFSFSSSENGSTFQCMLDGAAWSACTSPQSYSSLATGSHTFAVRAIDAAGNVDPTPASVTWTVTAAKDTTPPDTTITGGPAQSSSTTSTSATFTFTSTEAGTFQCALDGGSWAACSSPTTYSSLAPASHTFQVRAIDQAGNVDPTPASRSWTVTQQQSQGSGDPTMIFVGDQHACDSEPGAFSAVAQMIESVDPNGVDPIASLGDESGDQGTASEFSSCFDPVWAPLKARTHPAIGNHDWETGNANGYFGYWGAAAGPVNEGWYSYDVGTWHIVVLSSYCGPVGGCGNGSPQVQWLKSDLAAHQNQCTLAYWHHPLFTSSPQPGTSGNTQAFWNVLYQYGADVIVNAHVHEYERFAPQDPSGNADPTNGIREFIVATGGGPLVGWSSRAANSQVIEDDTYGFLELTLHPGSYNWSFVPAFGGSFTDSGSGTCH